MSQDQNPDTLSAAIDAAIRALSQADVPHIRAVRKKYSTQLADAGAGFILDLARRLQRRYGHRWVAYELIRYHEAALSAIGPAELEEFGAGIDSWGAVDAFSGFLAGPAWLRGQVSDELILGWTRSPDRWWRRAALVSTVVLNSPRHGGHGDIPRTLAVCRLLVDDRDDMVVKAMSWALRKLVQHNPATVKDFLAEHDTVLASRVKREVNNKLNTGLKNPKINTAEGQ